MQEVISAAEFINSYENEKTRTNTSFIIKRYMRYLYPDETKTRYNELSIQYIKELRKGRDLTADLKGLIEKFKQKHESSTTKVYLQKIMYWTDINEIQMSKWKRKQIYNVLPKGEPEYEEGELTRDKLFEIYRDLSDKNKVLMLIMISSGARIRETSLIRYEDIDFENEPARIKLRPETTKNGRGRTILISSEAEEAIKEYAKNKGITKGLLIKKAEGNFKNNWYKNMRMKGEYEYINDRIRYKIHIHMFRKWFLSQFKLYASTEIGELLAGHEGYLTSSYRRYTKEEITTEYRKAEKALSILNDYKIITESSGSSRIIEGACYEC